MRKSISNNLYREPLGFVNSGEPQSGPDLKDHEEIDIASISTTNDRSKMDRYDGPPNSLNLTVRGISLFSEDALTQGIPFVWQVERTTFWEEDWLFEIFNGIELVNIEDGQYKKFIDNSIIIFSSYHNTEGCVEYFEEMHKRGYTFGIIHLSDESEVGPSVFYPYAAFVLRNYWRSEFDVQKNVITFPLGYGPGFWESRKKELSEVCHREYIWSFAGMVRFRPTRKEMINHMKKVPHYFFLETDSWGRNDPISLTASECRELLLKTIFVPCPGGWKNMDSFRVYEALECGCIPIVETFPRDYFRNFFPNHPFLTVDSWEEAPALIQTYIADSQALEKKRLECYGWWQDLKKYLNQTLVSLVKQTILFISPFVKL